MSESGYGVLVAVDGSPQSEAAAAWAAREAVLRGTPLTLAHVIAPVNVGWPASSFQGSFNDWQRENADLALEQARKAVHGSTGTEAPPDIRVEVMNGPALQTLVDASHDTQLLVVGTRGMGAFGRLLLGSTSSGLAHHAHCPVAIIRHETAPDPALPVLVGVDGSPSSEAATALAFDEASWRGVDLIALHAWSDVDLTPVIGSDWHEFERAAGEVLAERLAGWQERYPGVTVRQRVVSDRAAHWLINESENAQLVVVGSRGRGGFKGLLLGSVSSAVVQTAKTPVIVVRSR